MNPPIESNGISRTGKRNKNILQQVVDSVVQLARYTPTTRRSQTPRPMDQHKLKIKRRLRRRKQSQLEVENLQQKEMPHRAAELELVEEPRNAEDTTKTQNYRAPRLESKQKLQKALQQQKTNARLALLISGIDSTSSCSEQDHPNLAAFEPIGPVLLQQRFEELEKSYKHFQLRLAAKEQTLKTMKAEMAKQQGKYNRLFDEYCSGAKRFEKVCMSYLDLQATKREELNKYVDALVHACHCVVIAQHAVYLSEANETHFGRVFDQNLELFLKSLHLLVKC